MERAPHRADPPTLSQRLAAFVAGLRYADIPAPVVDAAKRSLLDTLGVALTGSQHPNAANALGGIRAIAGSTGSAVVWGTSATLAPAYAALANGVASHVLDFDDTHTDSITHGSAVLVPVALALGTEVGAGGDVALAAFIAGWEVTARVGLASRGTFHKRGFHTTSVAGVFGATAAASRLTGLTAQQTAHALGLAGSQVCGVSEYLSNGSSSKAFHPGWAALSGLVAASLARAGMTGPMTVFEGRYGTFRTYGLAEECDIDAVAANLGERWETSRISIKPYPCCHFAHAYADCALALRRQGVAADEVERLHCVVPEIEVALICEPLALKLRPATPYDAKFSLPFVLAAALVDGAIGQDTFTPANIARTDLLRVAQRVSYRVAAPGESSFPRYFPGWVEATLRDGRVLSEKLDVNRGNPDNPLAASEVDAKFAANAVGVLDDASAKRVVDVVRALEHRRVAALADALGAITHLPPRRSRALQEHP
jgi:2-methylcitrate dehydratase PrpD